MKKLSLALAALALCGAANAATIPSNFAVTVAFTPTCVASTSNPTSIAFPAYTAFGTAVNLPQATFAFDCSRGTLAIATLAIAGGVSSTSTTAATGYFSNAGLNYFLTLGTPSATGGTAATAANGAIGTAQTISVTVDGIIPQQAGNANGTTPVNDTDNRVLTITF